MTTVQLQLPQVEYRTQRRPRNCPYCESGILQSWGQVSKPISDVKYRQAITQRYRCADCLRTFRIYPKGVARVRRTNRTRTLGAFAWNLGLTLDNVVEVFNDLGLEVSRSSIWRDGARVPDRLRRRDVSRWVQVLNKDSEASSNGDPTQDVTLILDLGEDRQLRLGIMDEEGPQAICTWLIQLALVLDLEITALG